MTLDSFTTFNLAIFVLALGKILTKRLRLLRDFNIPEPVTGGLIVCVLLAIYQALSNTTLSFDLAARDFLLLYFFSAIGLNSDFATLRRGGKPLLILLAATVVFMFLQNSVGVTVAHLVGLDQIVGLLGGTVSLIGGHGTTIAWAPIFITEHGITNALEIGVACATVGLVLASLIGGPIARYLIQKNQLAPAEVEQPDIGISHETTHQDIDYFGLLRTLFWLNMSLVIGQGLDALLTSLGINLPLFVCSLFGAIILTNLLPRIFPRLSWPARSRSLALVSDISLGLFLAMSLMSLQLLALLELAGPIFALLLAQLILATLFTLFILFRLMGRDYEAAVICAGFGGVTLGATPTAIANMTAVTQKYGSAHRAFIVVPLVSGFFIDIANAFVIKRFLAWFG
jgi:glutamate:Na+ symporter, ESS family